MVCTVSLCSGCSSISSTSDRCGTKNASDWKSSLSKLSQESSGISVHTEVDDADEQSDDNEWVGELWLPFDS